MDNRFIILGIVRHFVPAIAGVIIDIDASATPPDPAIVHGRNVKSLARRSRKRKDRDVVMGRRAR